MITLSFNLLTTTERKQKIML